MLVLCVSALGAQEIRTISVHGHRGTRGTRPENTLPAFEEALRAGVDVLELDMAVTKDGYIVVSHEPRITPERCLAPDGTRIEQAVPIHDLTLAEVRRYDCGSLPNPAFSRQIPAPGARIPTLDEVFALAAASKHSAAAKVEFNIETKIYLSEPQLTPSPAEFAKLVAETVIRNEMEKRTIVQSFDVRTLREIKKIEPKIRTAQLTREQLLDIAPALKKAKTDIWSPNYQWITPDSVKDAHEAGIQVAPWTVNTPKEWDKVIADGADAIITDYPAELIAYLKTKKLR
jgi:glycerophosphoryl diester phosphodiesterase